MYSTNYKRGKNGGRRQEERAEKRRDSPKGPKSEI